MFWPILEKLQKRNLFSFLGIIMPYSSFKKNHQKDITKRILQLPEAEKKSHDYFVWLFALNGGQSQWI